jgi:hypothetical protein
VIPPTRDYIACYRVAFAARSELHARRTAEHFRQHIESTLDEGDTVDTTQLFVFDGASTPEQIVNHLKIARNDLCRLGYSDTMNIAQLVDQVIWRLEQHVTEDDEVPENYDWNRVPTVFDMIKRGVEPLI